MFNRHLPITMLMVGGLFLASTSFAVLKATTSTQSTTPVGQNIKVATDFQPPDVIDPFAKLTLAARSAIVIDAKTGEIIYGKNINEKLPLASITKVMTALVASGLMPSAENTVVTITPADLLTEGDSGLVAGQIWKLKDLMDFSLVVSSNDGARAIASAASAVSQKDFIGAMNDQAKALDLSQTVFKNETGLDLPDQGGAGAQSSAENIARLFAYVYNYKPNLLEATKQETVLIKPLNAETYVAANTNEVTNHITGLIGSKTGYTDLSGGNLAVIFDRGLNQPAVAVVLASTQAGRFTDVVKLVEASIEDLQITLNTNFKP